MMNMYKTMLIILMISGLLLPGSVSAFCTQNNNKIGLVGLDSPDGMVFAAVGGHDNKCGCNAFRFQVKNTDTKMALSILLAARMSGKRVRIDAIDETDCNSAQRVYVQDAN